MSYYRPDLAFIHDNGFGYLASAGAGVLIDALDRKGLNRGTVVELGCGSGITARKLTDGGYAVTGIDLSQSLIEMARKRAPAYFFSTWPALIVRLMLQRGHS